MMILDSPEKSITHSILRCSQYITYLIKIQKSDCLSKNYYINFFKISYFTMPVNWRNSWKGAKIRIKQNVVKKKTKAAKSRQRDSSLRKNGKKIMHYKIKNRQICNGYLRWVFTVYIYHTVSLSYRFSLRSENRCSENGYCRIIP